MNDVFLSGLSVRGSHAGLSDILLKKDSGHHALVLMAQQMTVKERYAPYQPAVKVQIA
jgi:hypothetical protein